MRVFRRIKMALQVLFTGWCECEMWNLDTSIADNLIPRLKMYKRITNGCPHSLNEERWNDILDMMIEAFEISRTQWQTKEETEKVHKGLELFAKYFQNLWD